jgi:hypothetical protein
MGRTPSAMSDRDYLMLAERCSCWQLNINNISISKLIKSAVEDLCKQKYLIAETKDFRFG